MNRRWIAGFGLAFCLYGCGGNSWVKDGVSPPLAAQELADCKSLAQTAHQRDADIDTDIMASRGRDWQQSGVIQAHRNTDETVAGDRDEDFVERCMVSKGFAPGS